MGSATAVRNTGRRLSSILGRRSTWVSTPTITVRASGWISMLVVTGGLLGLRSASWPGVGGQDCDGPWVQAGPYRVTAHPVSWLPSDAPGGNDRQVNSKDPRSVRLWVRPPPTGTHQCHSMTPTGIGMMLTVRLSPGWKSGALGPVLWPPISARESVLADPQLLADLGRPQATAEFDFRLSQLRDDLFSFRGQGQLR